MEEIRNIIFDLGGVLLNIEPYLTGKALTEMGVSNMEDVHRQLTEVRLYQRYDSGRCTDAEFRQEIRQVCGVDLTDEQVDEAWNALLLDFPAVRVEMLQQLRENYHVFLLSNTNAIHYRHYTREFPGRYGIPFESMFHGLFLSFELGAHKPDPEIYRKVLSMGNFIPGETLFIDDSLENIAAAAREGIRAIHLAEGMEVSGLFIKGKLRPGAEFFEVKK